MTTILKQGIGSEDKNLLKLPLDRENLRESGVFVTLYAHSVTGEYKINCCSFYHLNSKNQQYYDCNNVL